LAAAAVALVHHALLLTPRARRARRGARGSFFSTILI